MASSKKLPYTVLPPSSTQSSGGRKRSDANFRSVLFVLVFLIIWFSVVRRWQQESSRYSISFLQPDAPLFQWNDINPSQTLEYHACFDGLECARLEVPLDWNATDDRNVMKAAVALLKVPAKVDVTDPRYGGMIILNPGGPGNSGVDLVLKFGTQIQTIVDARKDLTMDGMDSTSTEDRYFDVVSFDPRGVNNTTPSFSCFEDYSSQKVWQLEDGTLGFPLQTSNQIFNSKWARAKAFGASCSRLNNFPSEISPSGSDHVGRYLSTASVVRDMVEIVERHGQWREKTARKLVSRRSNTQNKKAVLERIAWRRGEEELLYWGYSYGTFLGQSFASMQPHRVGRLVLDGVVDADDYARVGWETNLNDIDLILRNFSTSCFSAGPLKCGLFDPAGPQKIHDKITHILDDLDANPLPALAPSGPLIITHSDITSLIFSALYGAIHGFPEIAGILTDLYTRNGTSFALRKSLNQHISCPFSSSPAYSQDSTSTAILCGDGPSLLNTSQSSFKSYLTHLASQSPLFASGWAQIRLSCVGYPVRPKWQFTGPFGGKTAHPVLFASQTLDPVTPLRNAEKAAKLFEGSRVLETEGVGHCTIAMPSVCAADVIQRYFQRGELPPAEGTKCGVDVRPFWKEEDLGKNGSSEVLTALTEIAERWPHA